MGRGFAFALALLAAPLPAAAKPVAVRLVWDGNDSIGGVLINRVRGLIAASGDKREVVQAEPGLAVIVQTIDPAVELDLRTSRRSEFTIYSLVINVRAANGAPDVFGSAALGYCAFVDLAACSREIVDAIDEEIGKRGLR
ncbi:MAG: hypothetical protein Q8R44_01305 [Novosphingobium sp.]|nr:hypothetical protein [Novosphingobium sp.]